MKKILAIDLLRMGDLIMSSKALDAIKRNNPGCELHLLVNKESTKLKNLMPYIDKFYYFDRKLVQSACGEYERSIFEPMDRIQKLVSQLNSENYEEVVNLTHTKIGGLFTGMIEAKKYKGLKLVGSSTSRIESPWVNYLNRHAGVLASNHFHYVDVHCYSSQLPPSSNSLVLEESSNGIEEANEILGDLNSFVCVQLFTSDEKKDPSIEQWESLLKTFQITNRNKHLVLLGAPFESEKIGAAAEWLKEKGLRVHPAICSVDGAFSIISRSEGLVTGDTSIKHMASALEIPILEVALGSSDITRTGVYRSNCYIVQGQASCFPCSHRDKCSQSSHLCSEALDFESIGLVFSHLIQRDYIGISVIAKEYSNSMKVFKTHYSHSGFWSLQDVAENYGVQVLNRILELSAWKLFNRNEHKKLIGEFGSEGLKLHAAIRQMYPKLSKKELSASILMSEVEIKKRDSEIQNLSLEIKRESEKGQGSEKDIINFVKLRQKQMSVSEEKNRNEIKKKILRTFKNQVEEFV